MAQGFAKSENAINDHGLLTGLGDDDHSQYLNTTRHDAVVHDYVLLGSATADGTSVTLTVSSLAQTHHDLLIMFHGSNNGSVTRSLSCRFNGDTGSNYRYANIYTDDNGTPTTIASQGDTLFNIGRTGDDGFLTSCIISVHGYSASLNHGAQWQSYGTQGTGAGNARSQHGSGAWLSSSSAITSVSIITNTDQFSNGSTLRVYGLGAL